MSEKDSENVEKKISDSIKKGSKKSLEKFINSGDITAEQVLNAVNGFIQGNNKVSEQVLSNLKDTLEVLKEDLGNAISDLEKENIRRRIVNLAKMCANESTKNKVFNLGVIVTVGATIAAVAKSIYSGSKDD